MNIFRVISFKEGYHFKMHSHKRIELNYIVWGSCVMMLKKRLVKLNKNDCILIWPDTKHDFYVNSKTGIKIVQLEFLDISEKCLLLTDALVSDFFDSVWNYKENFLVISNSQEIKSCMERIVREYKLKLSNFKILNQIYFFELTLLLEREIKKHKDINSETPNNIVNEAIQMMHENYTEGISISQLANNCKVSERNLRKLFKKHTVTSPQEYFNHIKLQKAVELLANQNIPVNEIAYSVGFNTPQYFSRVFKKKYGFSPLVYRKFLLA